MTLLEKLLAITEEFGSLSKSGTNPAFKYSYVKGEDSMKQFRVLEIKHKIKVIPVVQANSLVITPKKDTGFVTTFIMDYNIYDLESDAKLVVSIPTQGYDTTDKATFKGMTGSFKYFLLQTFSYSTDDPEASEETTEEVPFEVPTNKVKWGPKVVPTPARVVETPSNFKFTTNVPEQTGATNVTTPSKFSDMLPKNNSVSFKDSGLSGSFKPVETK
jgi:hypothetical protein